MTAVAVVRQAIAVAAAVRITLTPGAITLELTLPRKEPRS